MEKVKDDDIKDDFMIIENYDNPDKSLDLKIILQQMLEMKQVLEPYSSFFPVVLGKSCCSI